MGKHMEMIQNSTKMAEVSHCDDQPLICWNPKCKKSIALFGKYFLDTLWDRVYCHQCGLCLRFARNRALKRGDTIESAEVES